MSPNCALFIARAVLYRYNTARRMHQIHAIGLQLGYCPAQAIKGLLFTVGNTSR